MPTKTPGLPADLPAPGPDAARLREGVPASPGGPNEPAVSVLDLCRSPELSPSCLHQPPHRGLRGGCGHPAAIAVMLNN